MIILNLQIKWERMNIFTIVCISVHVNSIPFVQVSFGFQSSMVFSIYILYILCCSVMSDSATLRTAAHQASLSFTVSRSLFKLMSIESMILSNYLILCHPLLLLPSMFPSIRVFSNKSALCIRYSKYWSFSISPSNEYSELISCRIDWFDLLAVQ